MAEKKSDKTDAAPASPAAPTDLLAKFLSDLAQLPKPMLEGMLNQAENEDEKVVLRNLGETLTSQFSELAGFLREGSGRLSAQQRQESEQVLRLSSAGFMFLNINSMAGNLAPQVAKMGVVGIIGEIKKIIRMLLEAFGITLPKWLETLFLLIDQLVNLFFSTGSPALATTLSRMEQDYLAELTQLSRLQRENELRADLNNEENT
jgi:hypothetical protein